MLRLFAERRRAVVFTGTIYEDAEETEPAILASGDKLRIKIGRSTAAPAIDVVSGETTDNGSTLTIDSLGTATDPAAYTLKLLPADVNTLVEGPHDIELLKIDSADNNYPKTIEFGVMHVRGTMAGDV